MSTITTPSLPSPSLDQAYMVVSALEAGQIEIPVARYLDGASESERILVPTLSFLLTHSKTGAKVVFDLGLRKNIETFPPAAQRMIRDVMPVQVEQDVAQSLVQGGVNPEEVQYVVLSHLHFDHIGDASWFPKSTFIVGEAARNILQNSYPQNPTSRFFETSIPTDGRTRFLNESDFTTSIAEFPRAWDLFNDGSLFIVDAPGHLDGHLNILARNSSTGGWILLAGDTCHHLKLFEDGKFSCQENEKGETVTRAHADKGAAELHLERVKRLRRLKEVLVLIAHDYKWYGENKGGKCYLPGNISPRA